MAKSAVSMNPTRDDFESLLEESYADRPVSEGSVVKGKVLAIENDLVIVDVGLKTEGRIALKEFAQPGKDADSRSATLLKFISSASRMLWAKPCSAAKKPSAKKPGPASKKCPARTSASMA